MKYILLLKTDTKDRKPNLRPRSHENGTERSGTDQNGTERNFLRGAHTTMGQFAVLISSSLESKISYARH